MATTITGKLNNPANEFQAGESTGFGMRLGKQYFDRESGQKEWTNYEFVVFTNNQSQVDFYRNNLIKGSVVEVTSESEKVKSFDGDYGIKLSIELINAKLGYIHSASSQQESGEQSQPQAQPQAPESTGYFYSTGESMEPATSQRFIKAGINKWKKGDPQPDLPAGF